MSKKIDEDVELTYGQNLGTRIRTVANLVGGKRALSDQAGLRESHIYRYIKGENIPAVNVVVDIAHAGDVNLDWLATGNGLMQKNKSRLSESGIDQDCLIQIIEKVEEVIEERQVTLVTRKKAQVVCLIYELVQVNEASNMEVNKATVQKFIDLVSAT